MKELSVAESQHISTYQIQEPEPHHDHRLNKKPRDSDEIWREVRYMRGPDINLLANSLTSRLRKAARQRVGTTSSTGTFMTASASSMSAPRSAPQSGSEHHKKSNHSSARKEQQTRPSILKRTGSKESAERYNGDACDSPLYDEGIRLPDVFGGSSGNRGSGYVDDMGREIEGGHYNNQLLDRRSPALGGVGGVERAGREGGGGGRWAGGGQVPVRLIKKAGIFQPLDKYATGRQTLHGDDQPFSRALAVDYETVTLPSRPDSGQESVFSASTGDHGRRGVTSGWSSGKSLYSRKKGLKVSWKDPGAEGPNGGEAGDGGEGNNNTHPMRLRSAGTVTSDAGGGSGAAFAFVKPKFVPGKNRVPYIGLKWKVPTPKVGSRASTSSPSSEATSVSSKAASDSSGHNSPASAQSLSSASALSQPHLASVPHDGKANHQQGGHHRPNAWRAMMYPRDVHPVTTAMEREGTSVSKTKWHVPGTRQVPAYTFIEDLMESRCHQWNPHLYNKNTRPTTRATVDGQSLAVRLAAGETETRRKGRQERGGEGGGDSQRMYSDGGTLSSSAYTGCFSDGANDPNFTYRS